MIDELLKQIYKMMQETQTGLHECYDNADLSYNKGRFEVLCEIQDLIREIEENKKDDDIAVVRCNSCVYSDQKPIADGRFLCKRHSAYMYYCSDGRRR